MKKFLLLSLLIIICLSVSAQQVVYSKVKIFADNEGLKKIAEAGVCIDHGVHKYNSWLIAEIADTEVELIRSIGYEVEVLQNDMASFYATRNNTTTNKQGPGTNPGLLAVDCDNNCGAYPQPQNFSLGSFAGFFTYQEILDNLDSMASKFPNLITVKQSVGAGTTVEGRPIYYVKISDNPAVDESEPEILYNSLHHAREAASISQLIYFMWYLLEHYGSDAQTDYLINNTEMYFVPIVNPDGYLYNYSTNPGGGGMWRKNRQNNGDGTFGVDLNRNYDYNWGYDNVGSSPTSSSDTYRGPSAGSEPETQLMKNFINTHQFRISVNNHTYSDLLIYPFGYGNNIFTPDSTQFEQYAELMTACNGFSYGTPNQTVGYTGNGTIDDWLYADTLVRAKVLSFTPEAGSASDGFWPPSNRIIPICQNTMSQNFYAAKLIAAMAEIEGTDPLFFNGSLMADYVHYDVTRLGMEASSFTVSVIPISANITSVSGAATINGLSLLQTKSDSIYITLGGTVNPGDLISYAIAVSNGGYTEYDTVTRYYGNSVIAFTDNCNAIAPNWTSGSWGVSTTQFVSATGSLTESASGNYPNNTTRTLTTVNYIDLSNALAARLTFDAKWMIEAEWDYMQVMASTDGVTYTPLCGKYTDAGSSNQDPGNPVYDGYSAQWKKEEIDLSDYSGSSIKLRFRFKSDGGGTYDGFYLDNVLVEKIVSVSSGLTENNFAETVKLWPNPAQNELNLFVPAFENKRYSITDLTGRIVQEGILRSASTLTDISAFSAGTYFISVLNNERVLLTKKFVKN